MRPSGSGRAAGHVDVHGHHPVDALDGRVGALVAAAGAGAVTHRHAPLGLRHLLPEPDERSGHLGRQGARHDEHVRLPRAGPEREHVEAVHVVDAGGRGHHLHGAAGEARQQRPEAVHAQVVEQVVGRGGDDVQHPPAAVVALLLELQLGEVGDGRRRGRRRRPLGRPTATGVGHDDGLHAATELRHGRARGRGQPTGRRSRRGVVAPVVAGGVTSTSGPPCARRSRVRAAGCARTAACSRSRPPAGRGRPAPRA